MSNENEMRDHLITEFTENYMDKLFYFCLKKTGSNIEAEDLTQDIALSIITALNKGTIPKSFSAWVWRIARNQYSVWATEKHRRNELITGFDIGDYEIKDESENILDEIIHSEIVSLLRRELAFISSDYRNIVVAYYMENQSIRDISNKLSLSLETVKKRLQRSRTILKEGMDMAREFGTKSYKPEEVNYINNCSRPGKKNQPHSIMKHKLYKNIFLEAYANPSTADELALELGVALPYMEDELEYLTRETFLVKNGNKYQTAFPIVSCFAQEQTHVEQLTAAPELTKALIDFVERLNDAFTSQGFAYYGSYQDFESAKWTLLMLAYDYFIHKSPRIRDYTERPDGGRWDIIGYQKCKTTEPCFVGNHGSNFGFQHFRYEFDGISERTPAYLTDEEAKVLHDYAVGNIVYGHNEAVEKLAKYGYLRKNGEAYIPAILILKIDEVRKAIKTMDTRSVSELTELADIAKKQFENLYNKISETIRADLPAIFSNDAYQCRLAISNCYFERGYVMAEALRRKYLLPAEKVSPVIGAHIFI